MSSRSDPVPVEAVAGLLAAFTRYPLVALGEAHWLQLEADLIADLLRHPEFSRTVRLIVVEFRNAYYQPLIDRYVAGETIQAYVTHDGAPIIDLQGQSRLNATCEKIMTISSHEGAVALGRFSAGLISHPFWQFGRPPH